MIRGVRAVLPFSVPAQAHEARALRARRVRDVRPAVLAGAEVVDDAQVGALDRLDQLTGRLRPRAWRAAAGLASSRHARRPNLRSRRAGGMAARPGMPTERAADRAGRRRPTANGSRRRRACHLAARTARPGRGTPPRPGQRAAPRARAAPAATHLRRTGRRAGSDRRAGASGSEAARRAAPRRPARPALRSPGEAARSAATRWRSGASCTGEDAPVRQPDATAQPIAPVAGALRNAGGGGCGHLLLPAQVWPRPACAPVTP